VTNRQTDRQNCNGQDALKAVASFVHKTILLKNLIFSFMVHTYAKFFVLFQIG